MISPLPDGTLPGGTPAHIEAPAAPPSAPAMDERASSGLTDDEAREQRATMEREVHDQSRFLDRSAMHTRHEVPGAAPTAAPESDRVRGETLSLDELLAFRGTQLLAADGAQIGEIAEIYFDEATRLPEWIGADVHRLLGSTRVVAPVLGSYVLMSSISVPYNVETVLEAPAGDLLITGEHEAELYAHYEIPYSRDGSPTGLPLGVGADVQPMDGAYLSDLAETAGVVPEPAGQPAAAPEASSDAVSELPMIGAQRDRLRPGDSFMPDAVMPDEARTSRRFPPSLSAIGIGGAIGLAIAIPVAIAVVKVLRRRRSRQGVRSRLMHPLQR